jgi:hypothetical protein
MLSSVFSFKFERIRNIKEFFLSHTKLILNANALNMICRKIWALFLILVFPGGGTGLIA